MDSKISSVNKGLCKTTLHLCLLQCLNFPNLRGQHWSQSYRPLLKDPLSLFSPAKAFLCWAGWFGADFWTCSRSSMSSCVRPECILVWVLILHSLCRWLSRWASNESVSFPYIEIIHNSKINCSQKLWQQFNYRTANSCSKYDGLWLDIVQCIEKRSKIISF